MNTNVIVDEITSFIKIYESLTNTKTFDALKDLIDEEAIYWFSDGTYIGLDQIKEAFERTWKALQNEIYSISEIRILVQTEESAVYCYKFTSESKVNGVKYLFKGRGTNILRKQNGTWKIIHEHLSLEPKN